MGPNGTCHDYKIEVYRNGQVTPDDVRSATNDVDLAQHQEQALADDACLSDFFATAVNLSGATGSHADDNTFATKEPGEPDHAGNPGGKSLWYTWTAPTNTPVTFDTLGSTFDTLLAVYTGSSVSALSLVVSNDDINGATVRQSSVTFTPVTGNDLSHRRGRFRRRVGHRGIELEPDRRRLAGPDRLGPGGLADRSITRTFAPTDCEVVEGCEPVGTRTLLSFTTETRNIGAGDLVMGDPSTNSLFIWATCHQHYHFEHFANYIAARLERRDRGQRPQGRLLPDGRSHVVPHGQSHPPNTAATSRASNPAGPTFIRRDCPASTLTSPACPPGDYTLQIVVNPDNVLRESNTNNNVTLVPVTIPPVTCTGAPTNDDFANAIVVTNMPFIYTEFNNCATKRDRANPTTWAWPAAIRCGFPGRPPPIKPP